VEVGDLRRFGLEILAIQIRQDKIENEQAGLDQFVREAPSIAEVILVDRPVNQAGVQVKDKHLPAVFGSPNMA
jgi:hypothetical protein